MKKLLPSYFKDIGLALIIISIAILIINYIYQDLFKVNQQIFKWIFKDLILLGTTFISFSYQKNETRQITKMRFEKLANALLFGSFFFLFDSIPEIIYGSSKFELISAYEILLIVLLYFIILFHYDLYKMRNIKEPDPSR